MNYFKTVNINKKKYVVNNTEFESDLINHFENLKILKDVDICERLSFILCKLESILENKKISFIHCNKGGFIPIQCSPVYEKISCILLKDSHKANIEKNIASHKIKNIEINSETLDASCFFWDSCNLINSLHYSSINKEHIFVANIENNEDFTIINKYYKKSIQISETPFFIFLTDKYVDLFKELFKYELKRNDEDNEVLIIDNLINLCIMVKNGGSQFEEMLLHNIDSVDTWTILDTGSTDETIEIINRVLVGKKRGNLFQEPFINFSESRNRLFELAGKEYKFNLMLDDTYYLQGNIRSFLKRVRGDQYSDSFSIYLNSEDVEYGSNRVTKSLSNLKYIYKIHEVVQDYNNINVIIPKENCTILDKNFDYMLDRTMKRKELDFKLLYEELEENPMDSRTYYYLAQTYNLIENYEKAYEFFLKRKSFKNSGFIQERVDAIFEAARLANFKLNKPWEECLQLYEECYQLEPSRPEALYFIGIHYYFIGDMDNAYFYFKKAYDIGYPIHCQYSLKPTLSFLYLPKMLASVCYRLKNYILGEEVSEFYLLNNTNKSEYYEEMVSWYGIFKKLNIYGVTPYTPTLRGNLEKKSTIKINERPIFCFLADGGFHEWSGEDILKNGVGGSETFIIEMARYVKKIDIFDVYVFCNTPNKQEYIFEGVVYRPIEQYYEFIYTNYIHTCIVSRYSEYLPVTYNSFVENIYFILHDLTPSGNILIKHSKLKNIFCLTEWHVEYFSRLFESFRDITVPLNYGIDSTFKNINTEKIPYKFIYSSFPNRGLLELLQMWRKIHEFQPKATLYIYADVNHKWSNQVEPDKMNKIKILLNQLLGENVGIHYFGWVKKSELAESWKTADIWFYPCTFEETFCLTALECASSKTLAITNHLAALQNTVGDRGVIIAGDASSESWKQNALQILFQYLRDDIQEDYLKNKQMLIHKNFQWANSLTWEGQCSYLLSSFVLTNEYEYKYMYNWTNELPTREDKQIFLNIIHYFNTHFNHSREKRILEIGSYTGMSIINIVNLIPNSTAIAVDMWKNYDENLDLNQMEELQVENSFYKNIKTANLEHRITGIKGNSKNVLLDFIKTNKTFDFIYVDGSHLLLDCYVDLILAWNILEKNGILAIDDVTFKKKEILNSPYEGVLHFLKEFKGQYIILDNIGYRYFILKV